MSNYPRITGCAACSELTGRFHCSVCGFNGSAGVSAGGGGGAGFIGPVTPSQPTGHPSPALIAEWRAEAERWLRLDDRDSLQPACSRLLAALDELARVGAENERQRILLRRVACYAVVDPLGNPAAIHAARMLGIERDIDDCLEGRPERQ